MTAAILGWLSAIGTTLGLDKCVTAGDGGVYYVGDLFDKGNGKGNGKQ